ncbi:MULTISPECIES: efflux RND transporter permease subunit [Okeania]|uniref:Efflux RND transporter permease subunit n=1 Tax=Okeania hirsuta TaxID=1458930 RepID=A0A3N6PFH6_9CYAN|nr:MULTISPECIES: efflux RND transporter permease subunit [Okeania]NES88059.1 efflux RND transporter permease subunit [Okeania sp. SIO2B9]RQH20258.1 efflux RND transporter permease subunit [Okeania hirsuta]RQH50318.1 efflux RND transporter permease subunit [Okeania hirsuta]
MTTLFYRNFRLLILAILVILTWGISAFFTLPRLEDPELVSRQAFVTTFLPGADAERVEALVTEKIEEELSEIEEIKTYESDSRAGSSIIDIELLDSVEEADADAVWLRIRERLNRAAPELPVGASPPRLEEVEVKAYALIAALIWEQDSEPNYAIINRLSELLKDEFLGLSGTEKVDIFGKQNEEIIVEIDQVQLASIGLTPQQLSTQIQQSDAKVSAGIMRSQNNDLLLEIESDLDSLERIRSIPINFSEQGQFALLGDIAEVRKTIIKPPRELTLINGRPAAALGVFVESDYQIDLWAKTAETEIDKFREQLGKGLKLEMIFNQSNYIENRLDSLILNLFISGFLVFAITVFLMGWKSAIVVGLALPLSTCMVLGSMGLLDIPLHQMSITGIIVALGLLIDTAIIVVDEVSQGIASGLKSEVAITKAIHHLFMPLMASTLTTALAFLPIAIMPGPSGEFVGSIGISVILAVLYSLLISITISSAITAKLYHNPDRNSWQKTKQPWWKTGFSNSYLTQIYQLSLRSVYSSPLLGILLGLILPITGIVQLGTLPQQFFPQVDRDQVQIELELPALTSIEKTRNTALQVRELILKHPEIDELQWFLARSSPRYYYNLKAGKERYLNYAQGFLQLNTIAKPELVNRIQAEVDSAFPKAQILVRLLEQGPPFDAPVELRIYGPNLNRLQQIGEQARALLAQTPKVTHTRSTLNDVRPQLKLLVDEEEIRLAGLDRATVSEQLDTLLEGNLGGSILEGVEELPVRVRVSNTQRGDFNQIKSLDLQPTGSSLNQNRLNATDTIPLSALAEVELEPQFSVIKRRNGRRVNSIQGFLAAGVLPSEIFTKWQQKLNDADFEIPSGYWSEIAGEAEQQGNAQGNLFSTLPVILVLSASILVLSLNSFRAASIIGLVAICAVGLGFFSLWLFGYPFGFMSLIGTFGLVGIAINDSVVVMAAILEDPEASQGNRRATRKVVLRSTRHVIATTLTTMIGFVPLLLGGGSFWPPLAIAIAGGVGGSTLVALYLVPCSYLLLANFGRSNTNSPK